ncbi:hypothetical protein SNE40_005684 [Patella caerulea]|uniref:Temptin Cys/Cys disulfide domain-containing protein n=1 Tax=Patella caerulea TaxID=87958 RepID=A0AAN8Q097_PATCE
MNTLMFIAVIVVPFISLRVNAFGRLRELIPNGFSVKNPCSMVGNIWAGVGHRSVNGGGELNSFGQAFDRAGGEWTVELCKEDSDDDGLTNGEELGDPYCDWSKGEPVYSEAQGHPGICQPVGSPNCQHQRLRC